ncbi:hypothetical protein [Halosimplex sp. TS25]|uniref:hypothetical protein n=1 Tax=Halosimplex rarum TaxID=3396619 RepID=UPI0039EABA61
MSLRSPRQVLTESVPIAGIMVFWLVASWIGSHPLLGTGARVAGLVMALMYAFVRGIAFTTGSRPSPELDDIGTVLRVNALALTAAAAWFVLARLTLIIGHVWNDLALPGLFTSPADGFAFAFTATGVMTVIMYAIALGTAAIHDGFSRGGTTDPTVSPADD